MTMPQHLLSGEIVGSTCVLKKRIDLKFVKETRQKTFLFIVTAVVTLLDGRTRSFYGMRKCPEWLVKMLKEDVKHSTVLRMTRNYGYNDQIPKDLIDKVEKRALAWQAKHRIPVKWLNPVEVIISGVRPSQLFPMTKELRFINVQSSHQGPYMAALMSSFLESRQDGDRVVRVLQSESYTTSIYYLVNEEELEQLKYAIQLCNRKRVSNLLNRS